MAHDGNDMLDILAISSPKPVSQGNTKQPFLKFGRMPVNLLFDRFNSVRLIIAVKEPGTFPVNYHWKDLKFLAYRNLKDYSDFPILENCT